VRQDMALVDSARPYTGSSELGGGRRPIYAPNFLPSTDLPRLSPPWHASRSAIARRNADQLPRVKSLHDCRPATTAFAAHRQARDSQPSAPRVALPFRPVLDWKIMQEEAIQWRKDAERERDALQRVQYRVAEKAAAERRRTAAGPQRSPKRLTSASIRRKAGRLVNYNDPFVSTNPQVADAEAHQLAVFGSMSDMERQEEDEMRRALSAPDLSAARPFTGGYVDTNSHAHVDSPFLMRSGLSRDKALRVSLI
jgi:hypothetical protein